MGGKRRRQAGARKQNRQAGTNKHPADETPSRRTSWARNSRSPAASLGFSAHYLSLGISEAFKGFLIFSAVTGAVSESTPVRSCSCPRSGRDLNRYVVNERRPRPSRLTVGRGGRMLVAEGLLTATAMEMAAFLFSQQQAK